MTHDRILWAALDLSLAANLFLAASACLRLGRSDFEETRRLLNRLRIGFGVRGGPDRGHVLTLADDLDGPVLRLRFATDGCLCDLEFGDRPRLYAEEDGSIYAG